MRAFLAKVSLQQIEFRYVAHICSFNLWTLIIHELTCHCKCNYILFMQMQTQWASDIPACCPQCGKGFDARWNLVVGAGRVGRFLKATAWAMLIPYVILGPYFFVKLGILAGMAGGYGIIGMMFLPPAVVQFLGVLSPLSRRVTCNSCQWRKDYSIRPSKSHLKEQVTV
jgi:hypothetical protein